MNEINKNHEFTRREMEAGLEIYLMEATLNGDHNNNCLLWSLINSNGDRIRSWLNSLDNKSLQNRFQHLPDHIIHSISDKCLHQL